MHAKSITLTLLCLAAGAGCQSSSLGTVITSPTAAVPKAAVAPAAKPAAAP